VSIFSAHRASTALIVASVAAGRRVALDGVLTLKPAMEVREQVREPDEDWDGEPGLRLTTLAL
jgi:hypothetical protein